MGPHSPDWRGRAKPAGISRTSSTRSPAPQPADRPPRTGSRVRVCFAGPRWCYATASLARRVCCAAPTTLVLAHPRSNGPGPQEPVVPSGPVGGGRSRPDPYWRKQPGWSCRGATDQTVCAARARTSFGGTSRRSGPLRLRAAQAPRSPPSANALNGPALPSGA